MTSRWSRISLALALVAGCASPLDKAPDEEIDPDVDDLSADSLRSPRLHGELVIGAPNPAEIGPQRYHAWELVLSGDATVALFTGPQAAEGPSVDTVLALYRWQTGRGWGAAIARNDDHGGSLFSRVELGLGEGRYRAIVRGYSIHTRGPFALFGTCEGAGCPARVEPEPEPSGCHPSFAAAIRRCFDDAQGDVDFDPWTTSDAELMRQCADVEVVAPAWDALCLVDSPPALCGADLEAFHAGHLALCRHQLVGEALDATCVFGRFYRQSFGPEVPLVVRWQRTLRHGDALDATEAAQVIRAVRETAHDHVTTLEEAFAVVDEGIVHQTSFWDASNRRAFVAYEVGAGDNSFGAYFPVGSAEPVARIVDADIYDCAVRWGDERRACNDAEPCRGELYCNGRCLSRARETAPDVSASCADDHGCSESLVCAGAAFGGEGLCEPAWMRGRFVTEPSQRIPDASAAGATATLRVTGLASVSTDVRIDLYVAHPRPADLLVTLTNPAGTEAVVFDGASGGGELYLRGVAVRGFPGDESVNGEWTLRAVDRARGSVGSIERFGLELTSRWD
ncbi:MAG: proprotein convertase P-domain-containing protein [Sandaracinaceae bacterium]|nr:proprotein convertase P-domain-containing protein [Sandaracinaceae bacterium]